MNYEDYRRLFDLILDDANPRSPYDQDVYLNYTKLNRSRMKRWDKHLVLDQRLVSKIESIEKPQQWVIITEPWCGDAAHIVPYLIQIVAHNQLVTYDIQLRDQEPFLIEKYLTNGSKSIPKLIVYDEAGQEIFNWGPRPKGAQLLIDRMKTCNADFEATKITLQDWYNDDKGESLCRELSHVL